MDRLSARQAGRVCPSAWVGKICAHGNLLGRENGAGSAAALVPVALRRRGYHGGGDQRARLPCHRRLRPSARASAWRATAAGVAVEVRLQVDQIDREVQFYRTTSERFVGSVAV